MPKSVVGVLQEFENAAPSVLLCNLRVKARDGSIVPCAVLELIEESLDLTLGLSNDERVAGLSQRRLIREDRR